MSGKNKTLKILIVGAVVVLVSCGGLAFVGKNMFDQVFSVATAPEGQSFQEWRQANPTVLTKRGPAPQDYDNERVPPGVDQVRYNSDGLGLRAWVRKPEISDPSQKLPALIFFHGGFAFGSGDLDAVQTAVDRGFVVMTPMLRGENGNPGDFELFRGEVDDAAAAARWLSEQPDIDPNRIYAFGHSVGGGVSALLSLLDDVPIQHSGSSGGLYPPVVFMGWSDIVPFEISPVERGTRLLVGNIRLMKRPHYAYLGNGDSLGDAAQAARREMETVNSPNLTVEMIPGDHFSSFDGALTKYLDVIERDSR